MRLRAATVLVAAAALLASGCSDDSKPQVLPTLSPTATPTPTPVPIPSAATVHDAFGAAAFVRFYYDQVNRAYQRGNSSPLVGLGDPACGTCSAFVRSVDDLGSKGQRVQGIVVRVLSAEAPPESGGGIAVDVRADAPARTLVDASGKQVQALPPDARYHVTVFVKRVASGWVIRAVRKLAS